MSNYPLEQRAQGAPSTADWEPTGLADALAMCGLRYVRPPPPMRQTPGRKSSRTPLTNEFEACRRRAPSALQCGSLFERRPCRNTSKAIKQDIASSGSRNGLLTSMPPPAPFRFSPEMSRAASSPFQRELWAQVRLADNSRMTLRVDDYGTAVWHLGRRCGLPPPVTADDLTPRTPRHAGRGSETYRQSISKPSMCEDCDFETFKVLQRSL